MIFSLSSWKYSAAALALMLILVSCHDDDSSNLSPWGENRQTLVVYVAGENSLSRYVANDIDEILDGKTSIPDSCEVMIYVDDVTSTRIYAVSNHTQASSYGEMTPEYTYSENLNSASSDVLDMVLNYAETHHRARSYGLVMWSHASGWIPSARSPKNSFGCDTQNRTTYDVGYEMDIEDMASALSRHSLRFILFDACFMQSVEVAYTLRHAADYIIGSPAEIPAPGQPYDVIMPALFAQPFDACRLIQISGDYYRDNDDTYGMLLSVLRTDRLEAFAEATRTALHDIDLGNMQTYSVLNYFRYNKEYKYPDFFDIQGLMLKNLSSSAYYSWKQALDSVEVGNYRSDFWYSATYGRKLVDSLQYSGVSMFLPLQKYKTDDKDFYDKYISDNEWYQAIQSR